MATYNSTYTGAQVDSAVSFGYDPDNAPTEGSTKGVTSDGVHTALAGKQNTLTFDAAPTEGSSNPVTSGGVAAALAQKQDTLTFDSAPTAGSTNPVTSGGVAEALEDVRSDAYAALVVKSASGNPLTFSDGADGVPFKALTVDILPVQSGSSDPSPDNIRPISGWTGSNITRTGINVWDEEYESGGIASGANVTHSSYYRSATYIPVKPNTTYYHTNACVLVFYDKDKTWISDRPGGFLTARTFTTGEDVAYIRFVTMGQLSDMGINYPATYTNYEAYNGTTINVDWSDSAGTIYKGYLTYNGDGTWTPTATHKYLLLTGDDISASGTAGDLPYMQFNISDDGVESDTTTVCNMYIPTYGATDMSIRISSASKIRIYDSVHFTSAEDAATFLNSNNVQVVYKLATPIVGTPIITTAELVSLLGDNTLYTDNSGDVSASWRCDPTLIYQELTAAILSLGGNI